MVSKMNTYGYIIELSWLFTNLEWLHTHYGMSQQDFVTYIFTLSDHFRIYELHSVSIVQLFSKTIKDKQIQTRMYQFEN